MSSQSWAVGCEDIIKMLGVNVPVNIVKDTMENSGTLYTADDIRCLAEKGAPDMILQAARKMAATEAPKAADKKPAETKTEDKPKSSFDNADELGSDLPEEDTGDEDTVSDNPRIVEELIRLYRAKKVLTASKGFYDLLEKDQFPEQTSKLHYYLAKCLYELELYHGAQHYFMQVVRKGPRNPYFKYALPKLVAIAKLTGNDMELLRIVHKIAPESFPRQAKNHLYYLMGRKLYAKGELASSVKYFQQISSKSDLYLRSKFFEGSIHHERGKYKSAVKAFRDVYQSEAAPKDPRDLKTMENLKDLSLVNIARIYYEIERYENAENYYSLVERNSLYWPESLFERAWAAFMRTDLNLTLGLLLTNNSNYYYDNEYNPEVDVLRALTFFQLCEFNHAERILLEFEETYRPMQQELKGILTQYASDEGRSLSEQAFDHYFAKSHPDSRTQSRMFLKVLRNRDLSALVSHMDLMDREAVLINQQKSVWRDSLGSHLKKVIEKDKFRYKKKAGRYLLKELDRQYKKLGDWMSQSQIIRFEIVDAQRVDYQFKMENPELQSQEERKIDFATSKDIIYWPFNGEFWEDELGYYRYTEHGSCK
jgi:TolA-binding protein